jgi:hypothetical protein
VTGSYLSSENGLVIPSTFSSIFSTGGKIVTDLMGE